MYKILVVDDDIETLRMVEQFLEREGYIVDTALSARETLNLVENDTPELFIINTYLTGMDGLLLCRKLRDNPKTANSPIIFLTGQGSPYGVSDALGAGGDDYLRKPFALRELSARIRAHLRRTANYAPDDAPMLTVLPHNLTVFVNERKVTLTQVEFDLLMFLCHSPHELHSTQDLLTDVWQYPQGTGDAALVRNHIRNLRRKLESDPERPAIIQSRHGRGYSIKARIQIENGVASGTR
jgi:two-component system, OmpR family, alkaline phosphatase synthesis response regulator PhoP